MSLSPTKSGILDLGTVFPEGERVGRLQPVFVPVRPAHFPRGILSCHEIHGLYSVIAKKYMVIRRRTDGNYSVFDCNELDVNGNILNSSRKVKG